MSLLCLQLSRSKLLKDWTDIEEEVTYCFNEAKDNAKFIQALEKCCHCLYLDDPVSILLNIFSDDVGCMYYLRKLAGDH